MKYLSIILLATIALASCQKEPSFEDPNSTIPNTTTSLGQLVREVEVNGVDSNIINYSYDANGRLSLFDASGTIATMLYCRIVRNSAGLITQTIVKSDELQAIGLDSLVANFYSNASTSQYTYARYDYVLTSGTISDSIIFVYSGANISSVVTYEKMSGSSYDPYSRTDYIYTGGNVISEKQYDYDLASSSWVLSLPTTYSYDAKVNPLKLGAEGLLIGFTTSVGDNNLLQEQSTNSTVVTTVAYTYNYNAAGKPLNGIRTITAPGAPATVHELRFYYN